MITSTLSDGSISIDTKFGGSFHQIYPIEIGVFDLLSAFQGCDTLSHAYDYYLKGMFGASLGFVGTEDGEHFVQAGSIGAGGYLLAGKSYSAIIYVKGSVAFSLYAEGGVTAPKFPFSDLLPTKVACTPGAAVVGQRPVDYAVIGDNIYEKFEASNIAGYPSFSFGTMVGGRLVKAFGIKTGSWNLDYMPTTRRGGLKSIVTPQRFSMTAKQFAEDRGVTIMSSNAVASARRALREGTALQGLEALNSVYMRPSTDVQQEEGVLYVAAHATAACYRHYVPRYAVVDTQATGNIKARTLDSAIIALFDFQGLVRKSGRFDLSAIDDEVLNFGLDKFSYLMFNSIEVKEILAEYMSIYNEYLRKQGRSFKIRMLSVVNEYNKAVLDCAARDVSLDCPEVREVLAEFKVNACVGLDTPLPAKYPCISNELVVAMDVEDPSTVIANIQNVFRKYMVESKHYIVPRASTPEERDREEFLPIVFKGDVMKEQVAERVAQARKDFAAHLRRICASYMLCNNNKVTQWAMDTPMQNAALRPYDSSDYNHGCGNVCDISSELLRNGPATTFWAHFAPRVVVGKEVVDMAADGSLRTPENMWAAGFRILAIYINNVRWVGGDYPGVYADFSLVIMNHIATEMGGLWSFQARARACNQECVENMSKQAFPGISCRAEFLYDAIIPTCGTSSFDNDWCARKSRQWWHPLKSNLNRRRDMTYCNPSVLSVTAKGVKITESEITIPEAPFTTEDYDSILIQECNYIRDAAQHVALKYLIEKLDELGVLGDCTWCGCLVKTGQIVSLDTLTALTSFTLLSSSDLIEALEIIRKTGSIAESAEPVDYRDSQKGSSGSNALTREQQDNIAALVAQLKAITGWKEKVWASRAATPAQPAERDSDIIPYVLKLA